MDLKELITRSQAIRTRYHELERANHGTEWTIDEDLLALSNDIGNLDRLVMTKNGRYYDETPYTLEHKLAENIWWLIELSDRLDVDIESELEKFLTEKEQL
ncbi:nucleoside triphosphate pyrophosphohydrolase family protein [Pediococcus ethanolidurans]|uniref:MazG-like protein n=1 Tax=Pediococcus ethanolidurans TaxID=319653 RepID=UPI001C1EB96B|nr:MazG-like protein [Pediococcus ethanolidurans]MBU7555520.1 MazG-like protein [Pediococcus ethanolidurans]MBU7563807.1 MazG-like protein [Pediococcus ethanolidurans]MCT4397427.1 MazG-like protein [Pediococcus ethanolidurans]MCV3315221.1 MazG-like protein [Pediococcus ethanolidurans]MCV3321447.1 MazG-like protein [Pediococcus ethanolidurans]